MNPEAMFLEYCRPKKDAMIDSKGHRWSLSKPFMKSGYLWATDGCILVRCPLERDDCEGRFPDTVEMWSKLPAVGDLFEIPSEIQEFELCECCGAMAAKCYKSVIVGTIPFASHYLGKLRRHGVMHLSVIATMRLARFQTDQFEGVLQGQYDHDDE